MAGPVALVRRLLAHLWSLVWRVWNYLASLNDNDWLAATSNENRREQLFNASIQSESLSLPWTMEMAQLPGEDTLEFTCVYNLAPDSGLSDVQIDRIGVLRSVGVAEFYTDCLGNWPAFLTDSRVAALDWSESSSGVVAARLPNASAGLSYSPQSYPLVAFAFGSYTFTGSEASTGSDADDSESGAGSAEATAGRHRHRSFRCCLAAVLHVRLLPEQPASQIMRRFFLRWPPELEECAAWQPHVLELRPYFSTADSSSSPSSSDADGSCVVCQSAPASILLLPCRHACVCADCAARLPSDLCPLCRRLAHSRLALPIRMQPPPPEPPPVH
ncbi:hypothetical protein BOX15_Mlig009484g1 [Macrostomum lignano]|uniref:RING-type domain-containing protein n=1 Tax=Macrostomum lignano TaxID=282301 RepID=A0A267FDZ3_9PLAT|nr:hypothetical protein BOX15_Mlig009484g1 [Macrostomum lignano]